MGQSVEVDVHAVRVVAQRFDDAAGAVDDVVTRHLGVLAFDGAVGGRDHTHRADAVNTAVTQLVSGLAGWSRACTEIAVALRAGASDYTAAETAAADRLG